VPSCCGTVYVTSPSEDDAEEAEEADADPPVVLLVVLPVLLQAARPRTAAATVTRPRNGIVVDRLLRRFRVTAANPSS
jgi:hypothetical protein